MLRMYHSTSIVNVQQIRAATPLFLRKNRVTGVRAAHFAPEMRLAARGFKLSDGHQVVIADDRLLSSRWPDSHARHCGGVGVVSTR
jgi:hypothetical protein